MSSTFIVYVSNRVATDDPFLPRDIAIESSRNNQMSNISGILMGVGNHFLQVLEGKEDVLEKLLAKIEKDPRHTDLRVIYKGELEERVFGRWSMGCVSATGSGNCEFDDIAKELQSLCESDSEQKRESLMDLLIEIPKRFAENKLAISG